MKAKLTGNHLQVYFDGTQPTVKGWALNFFAWKKPYKNMDTVWTVHAGFLSRWDSVKDEFKKLLTKEVKEITILGLSQGGAIAMLAHEYVKTRMPGITITTRTYGAPRCIGLWGFWRIKERFATVTRIVNRGDIVSSVPPVFFGYTHVGKLDKRGKFTLNFVRAHSSYRVV
jgi:predicted lipase